MSRTSDAVDDAKAARKAQLLHEAGTKNRRVIAEAGRHHDKVLKESIPKGRIENYDKVLVDDMVRHRKGMAPEL